jgi:succinylglutamate desuccinylase
MGTINRVLIVGGTHGNEFIGIHAVRRYQAEPQLVRRSSFETVTLLGNPGAIAAGTRYLDCDLNRSFNPQANLPGAAYEVQRAATLRAQFGPSGDTPADFILDLHSTTANAGMMLILDCLDSFTLSLAAYLSDAHPDVRVYSSAGSGRQNDSLRSLAPFRLGIEVGPLAHGTLTPHLWQATEAVIQTTLDYLEHHNLNTLPQRSSTTFDLYQYLQTLDYPRDAAGHLQGMIHPHRHLRDYEPLKPGDSLFLTFEGEVVPYHGDSTVYPVFINEAAYYEKGIALCLTQKQQVTIS